MPINKKLQQLIIPHLAPLKKYPLWQLAVVVVVVEVVVALVVLLAAVWVLFIVAIEDVAFVEVVTSNAVSTEFVISIHIFWDGDHTLNL